MRRNAEKFSQEYDKAIFSPPRFLLLESSFPPRAALQKMVVILRHYWVGLTK